MHFFLEHTYLPVQDDNLDMKFGPNPSTPTVIFDITTQFQLNQIVRAFACQDGMMVVQKNSDDPVNLVNVIIKPTTSQVIPGISVKYYIYRGIKADSFFINNNTAIKPAGGASEFIEDFWNKDARRLTDDPNRPYPTPLNFGFGDNTLPNSDPNNLNDDRLIEDIFFGRAPAISILVTEGMWIGDFAFQDANSNLRKMGFEVMLNSELGAPTALKYFRYNTRSIDANNANGLALKRIKDDILSFIDPAAFFGMHYKLGTGVNTSTFNMSGVRQNSVNTIVPGTLYTELISKFSNRNRVYLDVRSEKGLSYNYYDNYQISPTNLNNIRLNGASENAAITYGTNGWPLLFFTTVTNQNTRKNKVSFRLRINGNDEPVLFIDNKDLSYTTDFTPTASNPTDTLAQRKYFYAEGDIKITDANDADIGNWTKEITLYYPHAGSATNPANGNLAYHLKVHYFIGDAVTSGNERLWNAKYYDSAFCSIDLPGLGDTLITNEKIENPNPIYIKEPLQTDGTGNFYLAAQNGAFWDNQMVLFYCKSLGIKRKSTDGSGKTYLNTFRKRLVLNNSKSTDFTNSFETICRQYQRISNANTVNFNIVGINCFKSGNLFLAKEDLMLFGITPTEVSALQNTAGLSSDHPRYIFLQGDAANPLYDESPLHHRYRRYDVMLQGLDNTGVPSRVNTSLVVYSRDNQFFCSENFASLITLSDGFANLTESQRNRIEYHIYSNGSIKINDNIDLAILRKSTVTNEFDVAADTAIANDLSIAQQIYYLHYAENAVDPMEICHFDVVMANKMQRSSNGGSIQNLPVGFNLSISYTAGDARRSYTNAEGDIVSDNNATGNNGSLKRYNNQKKKVFMVHFVTAETGTDPSHNIVFNATNNNFNLDFVYSGSRRRYVELSLAAAFLGAMIRYVHAITSTGFGFGDASAYPSAEHVNGTAMDSIYFGTPAATWEDDVSFIRAMDFFGVQLFRIGMFKTTLNNNLSDESFYADKVKVDTSSFAIGWADQAHTIINKTLHDTHLHSAFVVLNT